MAAFPLWVCTRANCALYLFDEFIVGPSRVPQMSEGDPSRKHLELDGLLQ